MIAYGDHYEGEWNSAKVGSGKYTWQNGDNFEGSFMNDAR